MNELQITKKDFASHLRKKKFTIDNIMLVIAETMREHKGYDNKISSDELFEKVFLRKREPKIIDDTMWSYITRAILKLKHKTHLMINHDYVLGAGHYYVPVTKEEAISQSDKLEKIRRGYKSMQKRVRKSVDEKWYKEDWVSMNPTLKKISARLNSHDSELE